MRTNIRFTNSYNQSLLFCKVMTFALQMFDIFCNLFSSLLFYCINIVMQIFLFSDTIQLCITCTNDIIDRNFKMSFK